MNPLLNGHMKGFDIDTVGLGSYEEIDDDDQDLEQLLIAEDELRLLNTPQSKNLNLINLRTIGGVDGLMRGLDVNSKEGLKKNRVRMMRGIYGSNHVPCPAPQTISSLLYKNVKDPLISVLIILASSVFIIGLILIDINQSLWAYGAFLLVIISVLVILQTIGEYNQQATNYMQLNDTNANVIRDSCIKQVAIKDLVVGDILYLRNGDMISADAVLVDKSTKLYCDESSLTGETKEVLKSFHEHLEDDCFLLASSLITSTDFDVGVRAVVIAVGANSQCNALQLVLNRMNRYDSHPSNLQTSLLKFYNNLVALGVFVSLLIFISFLIGRLIHFETGDSETETRLRILSDICDSFVHSIIALIIATPHSFAVAVSLAQRNFQKILLATNVFVKNMSDLEILGSINCIIFDKTGTLTENSVEIVNGWFAGKNLSNESKPDSWQSGETVRDASKVKIHIEVSTILM